MIATPVHAMPSDVAAVFTRFPPRVRDTLEKVRELIFDTARESSTIGPITETLKWGEPAYLAQATGSGSTIRLGWPKDSPAHATVYFNCKTNLVPTFREVFPRQFTYSGDRALLLVLDKPLDNEALSACLRMALTYHVSKSHRGAGRLR